MQELPAEQYFLTRPMFEGLDHNLAVFATICGINPGRIFVDDVDRPQTALAITTEGTFLVGEECVPQTRQRLRDFIAHSVFTGQVSVEDSGAMSLQVYPPSWEARLSEIIPQREIEKAQRYHYVCRAPCVDWPARLPAGYRLRKITSGLLGEPQLRIPEDIPRRIAAAWGDVGNLVTTGTGFCILCENEVVSWCVADCVAGDRIEVGINTDPGHRRRGLATIAAAAAVEDCLQRGFAMVGWHCEADNVASWKTAQKAGFRRERTYHRYYYMFDEVDHLAELGWFNFKRGDYGKTCLYYERVFAMRQDNPDYYYHLAALAFAAVGDTEWALYYLREAADHGWAALEMTKQQAHFAILHGTPAWEAVLHRIQENATGE